MDGDLCSALYRNNCVVLNAHVQNVLKDWAEQTSRSTERNTNEQAGEYRCNLTPPNGRMHNQAS